METHSSLLKNTRIPNSEQRDERSDIAIRSLIPVGAAGKYPAAVACASRRWTCLAQA
jgi:hypothetical protein